ncbi:MAG: PAS domain S-box protein, partial [Actinomycetota bacterium]|nr:PAS domain S-box protein [Actinomycetota bacterium]
LRASEERYRTVVQQAGEGIYLFDAETKEILETNPSFQRMLGHTPEELLQMKVYDLVPADPESVDHNVRRTQEQSHLLVGSRSYRRKDGSLVDLEVSGSIISYGDREVVCAVARDITECKRAERALREVREAERNRLARDLRDGALQDISYALAEAEVVRVVSEDPELDARLDRIIEALQRGGRELRGAVLNLRLGEERDRSLSRQLESLVDQNRKMAPGLDISLAVEGDLAFFGPAGTELLRALQEAFTNVRRHAEASSARITVKVEGPDLVAEVSDDGRGFGPDTVPGVGFRSMRERIAAFGGDLEVESEPGEVTRVCLRIPSGSLSGRVPDTGDVFK